LIFVIRNIIANTVHAVLILVVGDIIGATLIFVVGDLGPPV